MDLLSTIFVFDGTIVLRVIFSIFFGFLLGLEREITGKFAGLRTHILVCVGSTVFTLLSIYGFKFVTAEGVMGVNDPARIAAQIITGIGFIGAGTVMRHGTNILGITTAATLWVCAAVGMACGCGMFFLAAMATVLTLTILISIRQFEKRVLMAKISRLRHYEISCICPSANFDEICKILETNFKSVSKIKKKICHGNDLSIKASIATKKSISKINKFFEIEGIKSLEIVEANE